MSFQNLFRSSLAPAGSAAAKRFQFQQFTRGLKQFDFSKQPRLRINSTAPNFQAVTTEGKIDFYDYINNSWAVLFSHPKDFTPVCTTELGAFSSLKPEFDKRGVKLIGLSAQDLDNHKKWVADIEEVATPGQTEFSFPIVADTDREVAFLYDMVDEEGYKNLNNGAVQTIRSVYIIDPSKKVRLSFTYPSSIGRNTLEVLRVIDALQTTDKYGVVTPIDWTPGQDVIIPPTVNDADAKAKFGNIKTVKPYLRFTNLKDQGDRN